MARPPSLRSFFLLSALGVVVTIGRRTTPSLSGVQGGLRQAAFVGRGRRRGRGVAPPPRPKEVPGAEGALSVGGHEEGLGFIDTHCHLDAILPRLKRESQLAAKKAIKKGKTPPPIVKGSFPDWRASLPEPEAGFEGCVNIGCSAATLNAAAKFLSFDDVYGAFGIHPLYADDWNQKVEDKLVRMMSKPRVVAWGECGLDYFDKDTRGTTENTTAIELQRKVFARQLDLAVKLGKPIVVHSRSADDDTLELLTKHVPKSHPVHVHCFTGALPFAKALLKRFSMLHLGFTGAVTFKNNAEDVQEVARWVPLDRFLLETDGPYMAPTPFRGKVAHPGHVAYIARAIADLKDIPLEDVLRAARENTQRVYGI